MDTYDRQIIQSLAKDGKVSYAELAEQVNLSQSACFRRVQQLLEKGVIERFTIQLNPQAMGNTISAFAQVRVDRRNREQVELFKQMVTEQREVLSCHQLSGNTDFLLHISAKDIAAYTGFIENRLLSLEAVSDVSSSIVLSEIKPYSVSG